MVPYTAAIVTFRRCASLAVVLHSLKEQTVPPSLTVVADNDPDASAEAVVERLRPDWPGELRYAPVGRNLGPAGGWAHAVAAAAMMPDRRGDWVLVLDDDDPLESPLLIQRLLAQADAAPGRLGGIGLRGARWDSRRALLRRVEPAEGAVAAVDYLAGNGAPMYSWAAVDDVGFFSPDLFFGFEDLDLGFRLTRAGWRLLVAPQPSLHTVQDTAPVRSEWREYYKTRALTLILRRQAGSYAVGLTWARSVALGGARLALADRRPRLALARLRGAADGRRGRLGVRRYEPASNPPKDPTGGGA